MTKATITYLHDSSYHQLMAAGMLLPGPPTQAPPCEAIPFQPAAPIPSKPRDRFDACPQPTSFLGPVKADEPCGWPSIGHDCTAPDDMVEVSVRRELYHRGLLHWDCCPSLSGQPLRYST